MLGKYATDAATTQLILESSVNWGKLDGELDQEKNIQEGSHNSVTTANSMIGSHFTWFEPT